MATVDVSTWAELATAVATAAQSSAWHTTTIKLLNDIDMNDAAPEGASCNVTSIAADAIYTAYSGALIIDGGYTDEATGEDKRYVIKNLRTPISSPSPIFNFSHSLGFYNNQTYTIRLTFKNIDFKNLILSGAAFLNMIENYYTFHEITFENCRFAGSRTSAYFINHNNNITCNNCYFDMQWYGAGQSNLAYTSYIPKLGVDPTSAIANFCRFKESYGGWTWPSDLAYNSTDRFFTCSFFKMSGCRIEGKAQIPGCYRAAGGNNGGYYFPIISRGNASYVPAAQNVFDVSLTAVRNSGVYDIDTVLYSTFTGVVKTDIKYEGTTITSFTDNRSGFDGGTYAAPILATPAQMKDAEWLSNNGFNIVVPNE